MTRIQTITTVILTTSAIAIGIGVGARQNGGEVALRAAIERQTMAGDVRGAMAAYRELANDPDRAVAAQARLHLAAAFEAIGDTSQARAEYERLSERFADHPAAAEARARLAQMPTAGQAASQRAIWTGPYVDLFGQVSPDGRYLTFVDWTRSNNLMVQDLETGAERSLTDLSPFTTPGWKWHGEAEFSTISKDGTQVAYGWINAEGSNELRILPISAKPGTPPRTLMPARQEINGLSPYDWSPDGQWIASAFSLRDGSGQIALVSVRDGSTRVLRSVTWRGPERIFFSPDGQLIAYDLPANDDTDQRDIFVMTIDASREFRAVENEADDRLLGWSPDGRRLVFTSDRTGAPALWAQTFVGGRPERPASLLQAGSGEGMSLGITARGTLLLFRGIDDLQIRRAPLNLASAQLAGPPLTFLRGPGGGASVPDWSPDGRYLAHQGSGPIGGIVIRTVATGDARTVRGIYAPSPRWSPDGRSLLANGRDRRGRSGVYRIDAESGALTLVVEGPLGGGPMPQWSPDGTKIYYRRPAGVLERTLNSGAERVVFSAPGLVSFEIAPDGKQMAIRRRNPSGSQNQGDANVMVVSIETGEARELLPPSPGPSGTVGRSVAWAPDSSAVIVAKRIPNAPTELWLVPVTGGPSRKLEFVGDGWTGDFASNGRFGLSRDGRAVAWVSGTAAAEVWAVENLVPPAR
jgi:Tol biopolymer transport system component